ncbi:ezrin/radixin/moesin family protein [Cytophaga hutchinsonii]|jgi:regulator of replication initiation timing|nr:ezrin/radixin/moesin family protein [Cytophaga hutchinsonii]SFX42127.1 hypothetical protein SAMN04487930_10413 [Cytophaga hutchinsonii ATCC 33406]
MKNIFLPLALMVSISISSFAQMTKAEEKEWAHKIKSLTPASYKQLVEDKSALENQVNNLKQENDVLKAQVSDLNSKLKEAQASQEAKKVTSSGTTVPANEMAAKGVVYKVQIGAFKNKDLSKYFNNNKNFSGEVDADGTKKYTLGAFPSYWEADNFKKYLREMGVSDAWVVAYKDGKRIELKDALEGTL